MLKQIRFWSILVNFGHFWSILVNFGQLKFTNFGALIKQISQSKVVGGEAAAAAPLTFDLKKKLLKNI